MTQPAFFGKERHTVSHGDNRIFSFFTVFLPFFQMNLNESRKQKQIEKTMRYSVISFHLPISRYDFRLPFAPRIFWFLLNPLTSYTLSSVS
jgi:hypothetical protein